MTDSCTNFFFVWLFSFLFSFVLSICIHRKKARKKGMHHSYHRVPYMYRCSKMPIIKKPTVLVLEIVFVAVFSVWSYLVLITPHH